MTVKRPARASAREFLELRGACRNGGNWQFMAKGDDFQFRVRPAPEPQDSKEPIADMSTVESGARCLSFFAKRANFPQRYAGAPARQLQAGGDPSTGQNPDSGKGLP
jgi:hypothetical protein